jgi:hypothetical protein
MQPIPVHPVIYKKATTFCTNDPPTFRQIVTVSSDAPPVSKIVPCVAEEQATWAFVESCSGWVTTTLPVPVGEMVMSVFDDCARMVEPVTSRAPNLKRAALLKVTPPPEPGVSWMSTPVSEAMVVALVMPEEPKVGPLVTLTVLENDALPVTVITSLPAIAPLTERVVNLPVEAELEPTDVPSMEPASMSAVYSECSVQ